MVVEITVMVGIFSRKKSSGNKALERWTHLWSDGWSSRWTNPGFYKNTSEQKNAITVQFQFSCILTKALRTNPATTDGRTEAPTDNPAYFEDESEKANDTFLPLAKV